MLIAFETGRHGDTGTWGQQPSLGEPRSPLIGRWETDLLVVSPCLLVPFDVLSWRLWGRWAHNIAAHCRLGAARPQLSLLPPLVSYYENE